MIRSLSLAERFMEQGHNCTFLTAKGGLDFTLCENKVDVIEINPEYPFKKINNLAHHYDLAVVDGYHLNAQFEVEFRKYSRLLLCFEDYPHQEHVCDFLLDPTLDRKAVEYEGMVQNQTEYLLGPLYAPLRPEFNQSRQVSIESRKARPFKNLLINFGLTDPANLTTKTLKILINSGFKHDFTTRIVIGKHAPHMDEIEAIAQASEVHFEIKHSTTDMAAVLSNADLVIGSPGSSSWERCTLGVPSILISQAKNQEQIGTALENSGAALYLGLLESLTDEKLIQGLQRLAVDHSFRNSMSASSAKLCDGLGANRIVEVVEKHFV